MRLLHEPSGPRAPAQTPDDVAVFILGNMSRRAAKDHQQSSSNDSLYQASPGEVGGYDHAIQYLEKIKLRYAGDQATYMTFLETLQSYRGEQRDSREMYAQVQVLFKDAPDLLEEFKHFLPKALKDQRAEDLLEEFKEVSPKALDVWRLLESSNRGKKRATDEEVSTKAAPSRATRKPKLTHKLESQLPHLSIVEGNAKDGSIWSLGGEAYAHHEQIAPNPAWNNLISSPLLPHEVIFLTETAKDGSIWSLDEGGHAYHEQVAPVPDSKGLISEPIRSLDEEVYTHHEQITPIPAWKRLINHALLPREVISLIETIFTNEGEVKMIFDLRGDDAQIFIDAIHKALDLPGLPSRLRGKCLSALRRICGRQALLPRSLQIPICYNRSDTPLYCGGFADVWKGEHDGRHVAVKVLRVYSTSDVSKIASGFCKEVVTWNALCHPNVLPLLGITTEKGQFAMISEWMVNKDINAFIKEHWEANPFKLLQEVASGLMYIHSQGMIHGDLKGPNILIDQDRRARLADFGLLTIISDHTYFNASSSAHAGGTTRWMSPELLHPEQFGLDHGRPTKESDCYALGMVIYEVLTGQPPFASLRDYIVTRKVIDGERPARPEGAKGTWFTDDLWKMLGLCWAAHAQSRPSIEAIRECLEQVSITWKPLPPQANEDAETDEAIGISEFLRYGSLFWFALLVPGERP